jgi:pyruvate/2-oxoglutarate dehydrogenase complex dihydrolipoamide acyltransferase (E2) component
VKDWDVVVLPCTLDYDHRVIDGAVGGRFTGFSRGKIANPAAPGA